MREGNQTVGNITQYSTGYLDVASGTTADRPSSPINGMMRFNTDSNSFEFYQGNAWVNMSTGASATRTFYFYADQMDNPTSADWSVNVLAPATNDPTNGAIVVRAFDDSTEEGVGFMLTIPTGVTTMNLRYKFRPASSQTAARAAVMRLHRRTIANNTAVTAWSITTLNNLSIATSNVTYQYATQAITLATLALTAGNLVQFELTRQGANASDTLSGDLLLAELIVEFT